MRETGYGGQVLIVDDDPIILDLLEVELEKEGFRVTKAMNIPDLKQKVTARFFEFILLDLFLENESGLEAIPFLLRQSPYSKILMMSAHGTVELAVDAMEKGASSFVGKSKDPKELVSSLKEKLEALQKVSSSKGTPSSENFGMIGKNPLIAQVLEHIGQLKNIDSTILVWGDSGTGKELVARALHQASNRSKERFEAINCGAIPETLLESELFGHKKGAFTDAKTDRKGLFELCEKGTLLLDEISEMPLSLQVKLLRVLQEREVMPLGGGQSIQVNTRVIVSTNKNLVEEIKKGTFRADLFYRLNVLQIHLPTLSQRRSDIPLLIEYFLEKFNRRFSLNIRPPSKELEARLMMYDWPGNIRELQNTIERGVVLSTNGTLELENMLDLSIPSADTVLDTTTNGYNRNDIWTTPLSNAKKNFEKTYLKRLLQVTSGNISEVARVSGRYRADIYRLMAKYGFESDEFRKMG